MSEHIVDLGEKLHVAARRTFKGAPRRAYIGEVVRTVGAMVRLDGWLFVFNPNTNHYERRSRRHTRLVSLGAGTHFVTVLPPEIRIEDLTYETQNGSVLLTDGKSFLLEVNEVGPNF